MTITIEMTEREALALIAVSMHVAGPPDGPRGSLQALAERVAGMTDNLYDVDVIEAVLQESGYEVSGEGVSIDETTGRPVRYIERLDHGRSW